MVETTTEPSDAKPGLKAVLDALEAPTHLFVLANASLMILYNLYTGTVYENETHVAEIASLTRKNQEYEDALERGKAAELRRVRALSDLGGESVLRRPPNTLTLMLVLFVGLGVVAYGAYSGQLGAWWASVSVNAGYIVVGVLLLLALLILVFWRIRNRRRKP